MLIPLRTTRGARSGAPREILLRHCPFLEVTEAHREVVCSVHLGLMQGVLAEMRAPVDSVNFWKIHNLATATR